MGSGIGSRRNPTLNCSLSETAPSVAPWAKAVRASSRGRPHPASRAPERLSGTGRVRLTTTSLAVKSLPRNLDQAATSTVQRPRNEAPSAGRDRMSRPSLFRDWEKKLPREPLVSRDDYILARCAGRHVIHLGACDYPMTESKAARGQLLHQKMAGRCASLVGFDNDRESIALLRSQFGLTDILFRDLSRPGVGDAFKGDLVVCADVIEHVNNVGSLLTECNRLLANSGVLLVSTINAQSLKQSLRNLLGREAVHPDHVAYYSYATLGVLLERFGCELVECRYFSYAAASRLASAIFSAIYCFAPQCADGLIVAARKVRHV